VQRSDGVTAATVIVFIGSSLALLYGAFAALLPSFVPSGPQQAPFLRYTLIGVAIFELAFAIWGILSGIGLVLLREWARISMVVFSVLLLICSLPALLITPFVPMGQGPGVPTNAEIPANAVLMIKIGIEVFYGIMVGIGVWWLWFFNTRSVKEQFRSVTPEVFSETVPLRPGRPLSISIIGCLMVISSFIVLPFLFLHFPFLFLGVLLTGRKASLVILAWCAVQATAGVGLLRLQPWGRILSICVFIFGLFNGAATFLVPGAANRLSQVIETVQARMGTPMSPQPFMMHASMWIGGIAGVAFAAIQLWFVITRKKAFEASSAETVQPL
jgi:hypothetical protein